jgi:DNA-binding MarR family transcriptional regulator
MAEDFVRALGLPFMAHRLRRLSELILEGSSAALRKAGFEGPARGGSTLLLLRDHGPTSITEIAYRLRLSHPLIIKLAAALGEAGLVRDESDAGDSRRRLLSLTEKGRAEAARIADLSAALGRVFAAMFEETGADLYAALERFEEAAEARPIGARLEAELQTEREIS